MPSRWRGIDTSLTVPPARVKRCAASRTMASTSGSELGQPKPSLTMPIRRPRASPVSCLVYASVRSPAGWRGSRPSAPATPYKGPGADSEEKREPVSDIDIAVADSLKVLDLKRPIREADIAGFPPWADTGSRGIFDRLISAG